MRQFEDLKMRQFEYMIFMVNYPRCSSKYFDFQIFKSTNFQIVSDQLSMW